MKWLFYAVFLVPLAIVVMWQAAKEYDDGRCAEAGGVRVRTQNNFVCVKPIDLEKKP